MGKVNFDTLQKIVVDEFVEDEYLRNQFYFTGGTALSMFYLQHRLSEDLDFFSEKPFPENNILRFINNDIASRHDCSVTLRRPDKNIFIFDLDFKRKGRVKVDFNHYPYNRIEKSKTINKLQIDSLLDIGANKLLTINQRTDVKDFVDLFFLLKKFTIWDLLYAVEKKFRIKIDLVLLASDFLKVEEFDFLPRMLVALDLKKLHEFFKDQSMKIGKRITK